jgi:hypothetical protein
MSSSTQFPINQKESGAGFILGKDSLVDINYDGEKVEWKVDHVTFCFS